MKKQVLAYSRFVESPDHSSTVLDWFRQQDCSAEQIDYDWGCALLFKSIGTLRYLANGSIDAEHSPVVTVYLPKVRREILWAVGEVHFQPRPLSQFPQIASLRRSFLRWFEQYPLIYDQSSEHEYDYYLEGSSKNGGPIRAFPSGISALKSGRYFISCRESDGALVTLAKKLALRGTNLSSVD